VILINHQTFGEIYQIAKRIGSKIIEKAMFQSWLSDSKVFNQNDQQISMMLREKRQERERMIVEEGAEVKIDEKRYRMRGDETVDTAHKVAIFDLSREIIRVSGGWSDWQQSWNESDMNTAFKVSLP
jgi:hypothetical protein